ncbi:hypothetical protein M529_07475 [Sphingobium ummariense RL-3]|uniref:Uncharacterized protein n=1 Tax=Sphingobium ummariense RL-3 TaxID=1346791 RepID=T0IVK6_9SPHN|nr:hypothetical protein M529_07475 [Sphingobium ummariense RL-3]
MAEPTAKALHQRIDLLEAKLDFCLSLLDRLNHFSELVLAEVHAQRRDAAPASESGQRWSPAGYPIVRRNEPVRFTNAFDNSAFLASGWFEPEPWGTWGHDALQVLRFALEDYKGGYVDVHLTLQCFIAPGADRPTIDVAANGYFLGSFALRSMPQVVRLRLPPSCIGEGDISLHMTFSTPVSPLAVGVSQDPRIFGIGLLMLDVS